MNTEPNPYETPEKLGLSLIAEHELTPPSWSFDLIVAWGDAEGIYLGTDSGCSCPTPFESYRGRGDLTGPLTKEQALEEATSLKADSTWDLDDWNKFVAAIRGFDAATALAAEEGAGRDR